MIRNRETGSDEVIWSAIHYLDPDLQRRSEVAVIFTVLFAAFLIGAILIVLKLRGL